MLNVRKFLNENDWNGAINHLKTIEKNELKPEDLNDLIQCLKSDFLSEDEVTNQFLLELLRCLRHAATSRENQNFLSNSTVFLEEIRKILSYLLETNNYMLLKVLLQFLVNLIVSNHSGSVRVANSLYDELIRCLHLKKNTHEVVALLYNLHLQNRTLGFLETLFTDVLDLVVENRSEFAEFLVELFVATPSFWEFYTLLEVKHKVVTLEVLKALWIEKKSCDIPKIALLTLAESFSNCQNVVFQTISSDVDSEEPYKVSLLLEVLGCLCGDENNLTVLQNDKNLLINSSVLLINIHRLGKTSKNYFTSLQKLSELKEPSEVIQQHPMFGFKVGLIRLIGNLCWKNEKMQDLAREAEVIPVLLDCCNIDARNPLIIQWVILAIRNLCEKNLKNQAVIAGMHKEGVVTSAVIEEMGLTLHGDETGGIRVVPLDLKKS